MDDDDWLDIDDYIFWTLGHGYIGDLEDGYTDDVEERYTGELIDIRFVFSSKDFD